jgi:hypothetical protein
VIEEQRLTARLSELQRERETKTAARDRAENQREILQASYAEESERLSPGMGALADQDVEVDVPGLASP